MNATELLELEMKKGLFCKIGHEYSGVRHGVAA